jgi:hypothetical protein
MEIMLKAIYAIAASAIVSAGIVAFPSFLQFESTSAGQGSRTERAAGWPLRNECSQKTWPYFQESCLRVTQSSPQHSRVVRIIPADQKQKVPDER